MNQMAKRGKRVKQFNEVALLVMLLVGAVLFAYLALGFSAMLTESLGALPWTTP